MSEPLGIAAVAVTLTLGVCTLIGLMIRYGLLPYLREQLKLTRETHAQVTHTGDLRQVEELTIPEKLEELSGEIADASAELGAMAQMFDGHLEWAQAEVDRIWARLKQDRAEDDPPPPGRHIDRRKREDQE